MLIIKKGFKIVCLQVENVVSLHRVRDEYIIVIH